MDKFNLRITRSPDIVVNIEAPLGLVHQLLTDNEKKLEFVPGIKEVRGDDINRLNGTHTCIFDDLEIHFVTTENKMAKDIIEYSELADAGLGFKITTGYKLLAKGETTELSVFIREDETNKTDKNFFLSFSNKVKMKIVLMGIIKQNKKGIALFKKFCEETALKI